MDYIGSKEKLNEWIFSIILKENKADELIFLDACAGSGSVSKYAAKMGFKKIISNDLLSFSQHLVIGAIGLSTLQYQTVDNLIKKLNEAPLLEGFFYQNYSEHTGKLYFTDYNAKKIDGVRALIEKIEEPAIKSYALYCLLEAMSSVSNTAGVQAAFLKKIKSRALQEIHLKKMPCACLPDKIITYNMDISKLMKDSSFRSLYSENILYIDPPYNQRQYAPNYHLYDTLSKNDSPAIYGKTGLRDWGVEKSSFCSKKTCVSFLEDIVKNSKAERVYISYSSDGILELEDFPFKEKVVYSKPQKRYKSDSKRNNDETELFEYLIEIKK
jgi:adenine-specific DNA-methyltransferase